MKYLSLALLVLASLAMADARQVDEYHWDGVDRIVAIGDLHGDYDNYLAALRAAGLVDRKGKWSGGDTHFVQTGDIPDRGPDTGKIIEHIRKLGKQAKRKGGRVHNLIGNHEAMNVYGDLRYVHEGEYAAFSTRNSTALRDRYFDLYMQSMEASAPERFAELPEDFREQWNTQHPLGWVEHRQAWDPSWSTDGEYLNWVLGNRVAVRVNDTIFLHGGISGYYCQNSLASLTEKVTASLRDFDPQAPGILADEFGPLWYRGLAGDEPEAPPETVDAILAHHGARHIVIGHTPTSGVIWPRYDGKVIMIDTGVSAAYGGHVAYLEITPGSVFAGYPAGKLPLPSADDGRVAYLEQVAARNPDNPYLQQRLKRLREPPPPAPEEAAPQQGEPATAPDAAPDAEAPPPEAAPEPIPICSVTP
jgi:hypothetical protein